MDRVPHAHPYPTHRPPIAPRADAKAVRRVYADARLQHELKSQERYADDYWEKQARKDAQADAIHRKQLRKQARKGL